MRTLADLRGTTLPPGLTEEDKADVLAAGIAWPMDALDRLRAVVHVEAAAHDLDEATDQMVAIAVLSHGARAEYLEALRAGYRPIYVKSDGQDLVDLVATVAGVVDAAIDQTFIQPTVKLRAHLLSRGLRRVLAQGILRLADLYPQEQSIGNGVQGLNIGKAWDKYVKGNWDHARDTLAALLPDEIVNLGKKIEAGVRSVRDAYKENVVENLPSDLRKGIKKLGAFTQALALSPATLLKGELVMLDPSLEREFKQTFLGKECDGMPRSTPQEEAAYQACRDKRAARTEQSVKGAAAAAAIIATAALAGPALAGASEATKAWIWSGITTAGGKAVEVGKAVYEAAKIAGNAAVDVGKWAYNAAKPLVNFVGENLDEDTKNMLMGQLMQQLIQGKLDGGDGLPPLPEGEYYYGDTPAPQQEELPVVPILIGLGGLAVVAALALRKPKKE